MGGLFSLCCGKREGAVKEDADSSLLWAPLPADQAAPKRRGGRAPSPAPAFGAGALRDDGWAQFTDPFQRAAGHRGRSTELSSSPPPVSTSSAPPPAGYGWESEPSWLREQALLVAQQAAAAEHQAHGERWGFLRGGGHRSGSTSPEPRPAATTATGSRARQRQPSSTAQQAPAFGSGALTKWH